MLTATSFISPPLPVWDVYGTTFTTTTLLVAAIFVGIVLWDHLTGVDDKWKHVPRKLVLPIKLLGAAAVGAAVGVLCTLVTVGDGSSKTQPHVLEQDLAAAIEEKYDLTSVTATTDAEYLSITDVCGDFHQDSPEMLGQHDGLRVRFQVAVPDCDNPDPEIVLISIPDSDLRPADLERL